MMRRPPAPRPGEIAWLVIIAYEVVCPRGELLSEVLDRHLPVGARYHRAATLAVIAYTAAHCSNLLPERADVYLMLARNRRR